MQFIQINTYFWLLPSLERKQERFLPHLSFFVLCDEIAVEVF